MSYHDHAKKRIAAVMIAAAALVGLTAGSAAAGTPATPSLHARPAAGCSEGLLRCGYCNSIEYIYAGSLCIMIDVARRI